MTDSEDSSSETQSNEINISLNKSNLFRIGIFVLFLIGTGASYYSYTLTSEVKELKSEVDRLEEVSQNKSQKISELRNETIRAKYLSNKNQITRDIERIGSQDNANAEVINTELKHDLYYAELSQEVFTETGTETRTVKVYVTLDGEKLISVEEQFGQVVSPRDIDSALENLESQRTFSGYAEAETN